MESGGGGGGGPAPFLLKTYEMVDDSATDHIVSWSPSKTSFVVWDAPEFSRLLLPTYFKHNNFSSFIRQLNTYGFRKIDPEKWEFANDDFAKDKKHLLRNIHRRKPIHSHSHPPAGSIDPERAALEDEIDRLTREKADLQSDLFRFRQQHTGTKLQLEDLNRRVQGMEERQIKMMTFLGKAVHNPTFVEHLIRMSGTVSIDFSALNKKRRQLPREGGSDGLQEHVDNSSSDEHSNTPKSTDFGHVFHQDFSSKLNLELSPACSGMNLASGDPRTCKEDAPSTQRRQVECAQARKECLTFVPESAEELMDTGASLCPRKNSSLSWQTAADETDGQVSCHLNLTLASSPLQIDVGIYSNRDPSSSNKDIDSPSEVKSTKEQGLQDMAGRDQKSVSDGNKKVESSRDFANNGSSQVPKPATGRVNDLFWEQFLTERPGSLDNEEASSSLRSNPQDEPKEDRNTGDEWRSKKDAEKLTL